MTLRPTISVVGIRNHVAFMNDLRMASTRELVPRGEYSKRATRYPEYGLNGHDAEPLGIATHLPMPVGMPTYAGTSITASGLLFFAGSQDFYLRANDTQTGEELRKYPRPVGSSATPMTYVSPETGHQYVVVAVSGAARSPKTGDYVMAFSLPVQKP